MKIKLLSFLLLCALSINAQNLFTIIPDNAFEAYLEANQMGDGIALNDSVLTININTIDTLNVSNLNISDLTGIEGFSNLQYLDCSHNNIEILNLNFNEYLKYLDCSANSLDLLWIDNLNALYTLKCEFNNLTDLNTDGNGSLAELYCFKNNINSLDLDNNHFLGTVNCGDNNLSVLDVSAIDLEILQCQNNPITSISLANNNSSLTHLTCHNNLLQTIDLSDQFNLEWLNILNMLGSLNNNNFSTLNLSANCNITNFYCNNNVNLYCIQVCDASLVPNWTYNIHDIQQYFSEDCNYTAINETYENSAKIISIKDVYGRESSVIENSILFYIYENGAVEKKLLLQ